MNFIALDVETANQRRASICSIGLVIFDGDQIVEIKHYLINPEDEFHEFNVNIHGITPATIEHAPIFPLIESELRTMLTGKNVVTHTEFDIQALNAILRKYEFPKIKFTHIDSCELAKELYPDLKNHKLKTIARQMEISFDHHVAAEDARVAGLIMVEAIKQEVHTVEKEKNSKIIINKKKSNHSFERYNDFDVQEKFQKFIENQKSVLNQINNKVSAAIGILVLILIIILLGK